MSATDSVPTPSASDLPSARIERDRRWSATWLIPLLAVAAVAWIGYRAWQERGLGVILSFDAAHGLAAGDAVHYRGMTVGTVDTVTLSPDAAHVIVECTLRGSAAALARDGSRFWIVRPEVGLDGVSGLDTVIGPRYIEVDPGATDAALRTRFVGVETAPLRLDRTAGDLEIVIVARTRGSLNAGAMISYRGLPIGRVTSVGLASDAGAVEARAVIAQPYRALVREGSRFWEVSGLRANIALTGVTLETGSLAELISGGIAMATPPTSDAGAIVMTGHRFPLADELDDDWNDWTPGVAVGSRLLPVGAPLPAPRRAVLAWRQGLLLKSDKSRASWVLPTDRGLVGPADVLTTDPAKRVEDESLALEIAGRNVPLDDATVVASGALVWLPELDLTPAWPIARTRALTESEECLVVGDPNGEPLPITAAHLTATGDGAFTVDRAVGIAPEHHGAVVVARSDGRVVGLLVIDDDDRATVHAIVPPDAGANAGGSDAS